MTCAQTRLVVPLLYQFQRELVTMKVTGTLQIRCQAQRPALDRILWFFPTSKVWTAAQGDRSLIMSCMYCNSRSVACLTFLR